MHACVDVPLSPTVWQYSALLLQSTQSTQGGAANSPPTAKLLPGSCVGPSVAPLLPDLETQSELSTITNMAHAPPSTHLQFDGYLVRVQDSDMRYMVAFSRPEVSSCRPLLGAVQGSAGQQQGSQVMLHCAGVVDATVGEVYNCMVQAT